MDLLLDTHTYLWFVDSDPKLSPTARFTIEDKRNQVWISIISLTEIAIKTNLKKLSFSIQFEEILSSLSEDNFKVLPLEYEHLKQFVNLPRIHGDPFDRILISQSLAENFPILSNEKLFDSYGVTRIW